MDKFMQISRGTLISYMAFAPIVLFGQAVPPAKPTTAEAPAAAAPAPPSSIVQPALSSMESTLNSLKLDKWKKGTIRDESGDNVKAILKDLKTNLPPLMADADAAPGALSKSIPLMKHLDALYDVLLRVEEGARVSAPGEQVDQLAAVLKQFGSARIQLYDSMTQSAGSQEKHATDMQATIKAQQAKEEERKAAPAPAPVPCTPPKPAAKKRPAKPKATPPANGQPAQGQPASGQPAQTPPAQPKPQ
jgi:hypothetical protein